MSIEIQFGKSLIICDICGESSEEQWGTFQEAIDEKKRIGWASKKDKHGWKDICKECQGGK